MSHSVPSCLKGFTLIEVMIVVAIVGILSGIAIPAYNGYINTSKMSKVTAHMDIARRFVSEGFKLDKGRRGMAIAYDAAKDSPPRHSDAYHCAY